MKKLWKRCLSLCLCFVFVLQVQPIAATIKNTGNAENQYSDIQSPSPDGGTEPLILDEAISKRDSNIKHFKRSDNSYVAAIYGEPVHYKKDGMWCEIDNTLQETYLTGNLIKGEMKKLLATDKPSNENKETTFTYLENKSNSVKMQFPTKLNDRSPIIVSNEGHSIRFSMRNIAPVRSNIKETNDGDTKNTTIAEQNDAKITVGNQASILEYPSILPNTDLRYDLHGTTLKESLVFKSQPTQLNFTFDLFYEKLHAELQKDNSVFFYTNVDNKPKSLVFSIAPPHMLDSAGTYTDKIEVTLKTTETGCTYTLTPDASWLKDTKRKYPVVLDPTFETDKDNYSMKNTTASINSLHTDSYTTLMNNKDKLYVGTWSDMFPSLYNLASLVYIPLDEAIEPGAYVQNAKMKLYVGGHSFYSGYDGLRMDAYAIDEATGYWPQSDRVLNGTLPQYNSTTLDYCKLNEDSIALIPQDDNGSYVQFDITKAARKWVSDATTNHGILLKSDPYSNINYVYFHASSYSSTTDPQLIINYIDASGIDAYGNYTTVSAGRDGKAYINNVADSFTATQPLCSFRGERLPVSIDLTYRETQIGRSVSTNVGAGWQLGFESHIRITGSEDYPYAYIDESGGTHYMAVGDNNYIGGGYTLYEYRNPSDGISYRLYDDSGTVMEFNTDGYIVKTTDPYGSSITINRDSTNADKNCKNRIMYITDGAYRQYRFQYANANSSLVTGILNPDGRLYTLLYQNGDLSEIVFPDTVRVQYVYTNHILKQINNTDKTVTKTGYENNQRFLSRATAYAIIEKYTFSHYGSYTKVVNQKGDETIYQFDENGTLTDTLNGINQDNKRVLKSDNQTIPTVENLLNNSGLDNNLTGYSIVHEEGALGFHSSLAGHNGKGCAYLSAADNKYSWIGTNTTNITPGEYYTFSAYITVSGTDLKGGQGAQLHLYATDSNGNILKSVKSPGLKTTGDKIWRRESVTILLPENTATLHVQAGLLGMSSGAVYVDDMQLECGESASQYNLINGLSKPAWTAGSGTNYYTSTDYSYRFPYIALSAPINGKRFIYQDVAVDGKAGDLLSYGSWAQAGSLPNHNADGVTFQVQLQFYNGSTLVGSADDATLLYNYHIYDWQSMEDRITAPEDYTKIRMVLQYDDNIGTASFSHMRLFRSEAQTGENTPDNNTISPVLSSQMINGDYYLSGLNDSPTYDKYGNCTRKPETLCSLDIGSLFSNTSYYICNAATGAVLTAQGTGTAVKTVQWTERNDNALWKVVPISSNAYSLVHNITGNYLRQSQDGDGYYFNLNSTEEKKLTFEEQKDYSYMLQYGSNYLHAYETGSPVRNKAAGDDADNRRWFFVRESNIRNRVSQTSYSDSGNFKTSDTNVNGVTTEYSYFSSGLLSKMKQGNRTISYTYGTNNKLAQIAAGEQKLSLSYYNDQLSGITSNGMSYSLDRNSSTNKLSAIGGSNLGHIMEYEYNNRGLLKTMRFGNGQSSHRQYDVLDRLYRTWNNADEAKKYYEYAYNTSGQLTVIKDFYNDIRTRNLFGENGRQTSMLTSVGADADGGAPLIELKYGYKNASLHSMQLYIDGISQYKREVNYSKSSGNKVDSVQYDGNTVLKYTYDGLSRLGYESVRLSPEKYMYKEYYYNTVNGNHTNLVRNINYGNVDNYTQYYYLYDNLGRVKTYNDYSTGGDGVSYYYNDDGFVTREDSISRNEIATLEYGKNGNITSRVIRDMYASSDAEPLESYQFTYGEDWKGWKDQLTGINGQTITYDMAGNPLSYRDGMGFTWLYGDAPDSFSKNGKVKATYSYDSNRNRISKTVDGVKTQYYMCGDLIMAEKTGDHLLVYLFDERDNRIGFTYDGLPYYYVTNLQGDVKKLVDQNGITVARYDYDVWGNIKSINDTAGTSIAGNPSHIGNINPIRYHGHYYDKESGLYWMDKHLYDPLTGRLLNPKVDTLLVSDLNESPILNLYLPAEYQVIPNLDKSEDDSTDSTVVNKTLFSGVYMVKEAKAYSVSEMVSEDMLTYNQALKDMDEYVNAKVGVEYVCYIATALAMPINDGPASNCPHYTMSDITKYNYAHRDLNRFDRYFVAFANYWNNRAKPKYYIKPDLLKAICFLETSINTSTRSGTNIMCVTEPAREELRLNLDFKLISSIYKNGKYQLNKMTVEMSICSATRLLCHLGDVKKDLYDAVVQYNGNYTVSSGGYLSKVLYAECLCRTIMDPQRAINGEFQYPKLALLVKKDKERKYQKYLYDLLINPIF